MERADLNAVLLNWGNSATTSELGDLTGDGTVGQPDLNAVLLNWGATSEPGNTPVPEPAGLCFVAGLGLLGRRRVRD